MTGRSQTPGANIEETYARYAADERKQRAWAAGNPGKAAIRDELAAAALAAIGPELSGGEELLDAGCGIGWWLRQLVAAGVAPERLHGVGLLEDRARRAAEAVAAATVVAGDLRALPYRDGRFTAVFVLTVLSSISDRDDALAATAEAWRVLASGGVLVVWEPRVSTPGNRATRLVRASDLAAATDVAPAGRTLTLLPPLARRLGRRTSTWYPRLARVPAVRTHRLHILRRPAG
jgi:SAM-dependent methyltransferase